MWSKNFWVQAFERVFKSVAQALLGMGTLDAYNILNADLKLAGGIAGGAAVLSLLTSVVTSGVGEPNDPSAVEKVGPEDVRQRSA